MDGLRIDVENNLIVDLQFQSIDIDSSDAEEDKFTVGKCELHFDGHSRQYSRTTNNMMYTHQADFDEDSEGEYIYI